MVCDVERDLLGLLFKIKQKCHAFFLLEFQSFVIISSCCLIVMPQLHVCFLFLEFSSGIC